MMIKENKVKGKIVEILKLLDCYIVRLPNCWDVSIMSTRKDI